MTHVERVLFVHAHADDESISTGGTIARLVDDGAHVTVLTCTRTDQPQQLAEALRILGVTDARILGAVDARWPGKEPREYLAGELAAAPFGEVSADIAAVMSSMEPTIVVSYNEWGGSGHPDHIRVHQAARRAAEVLEVPFFTIETDDVDAPTSVDISSVLERKRAAIAAHGAQATALESVERFRRLRPPAPDSSRFADQSIVTKISVAIVMLVLGSAAGLLLTAVHQSTAVVNGIEVPWGIIVALVAAIFFLLGMRLVFDSRLVPAIGAVGLLALSAILASPTRGGSAIVVDNLAGQLWTWIPPVAVVVIIAWPKFLRKAAGKIEPEPAVKGSSIQ
jgi:N-acetyl-1-D-myo-inositol-2-amino-2-deoxy-alpha-D-glucopyranoside deacetylase